MQYNVPVTSTDKFGNTHTQYLSIEASNAKEAREVAARQIPVEAGTVVGTPVRIKYLYLVNTQLCTGAKVTHFVEAKDSKEARRKVPLAKGEIILSAERHTHSKKESRTVNPPTEVEDYDTVEPASVKVKSCVNKIFQQELALIDEIRSRADKFIEALAKENLLPSEEAVRLVVPKRYKDMELGTFAVIQGTLYLPIKGKASVAKVVNLLLPNTEFCGGIKVSRKAKRALVYFRLW
jgi:hypothetical protein